MAEPTNGPRRWSIREVPGWRGLRRFEIRKGFDTAEVDWQRDIGYCRGCPAPLAGERTSCRHVQAVKRFVARRDLPLG